MLFDGMHDAVDGYVALLAERVVQLGGVAFGTARQAATRSTLSEYPAVVDGNDHLAAMAAVLIELRVLMREAVEQTAGWGDVESTELCAEIARGVDKWLWMVDAHARTVSSPRA
jgi:starvation-inducible DNA-binding protein